MEEAILNFPKQFEYEPKIENEDRLQALGKYILCGMGGSHLQGDIMQNAYPGFDLSVHEDYGLPMWPKEILKKTLIIASSYSGNTEETISAFQETMEKGYPAAVISTGGKLIALAKKHGVPYIQIPDTGIQPRSALGFTFRALAKMVGREDILDQAGNLAHELKPEELEEKGRSLAQQLRGKVPIMYASQRNYSVAYIWKINFNETGKIPAFYNVFPELNHNEMTGFSAKGALPDGGRGPASGGDVSKAASLSNIFHFIFLKDQDDHPKIQKRMDILKKLYEDRGLPVTALPLEGSFALGKIFSSLLLADWVAYYTALQYGSDPEQVPMVEEFKKLIG